MDKSSRQRRQWRIGELAVAAGTTVRALHHYEHHGLLKTPERTGGGHRVYDETDVERLYQILAFRRLGMSLEEIRQIIEDGAALDALLGEQLARVETQVERLTLLRDRLRSITRAGTVISANDLLATLDAMARVDDHVHARRSGPVRADRVTRWRALGDALRARMEAGDAPSHARVKTVASEVRSLLHAFAEGDAGILDALAQLRAKAPPRELAGWDPELMRYLDLALLALEKE
jgi:DNA-binding transcriptional MerR regulator